MNLPVRTFWLWTLVFVLGLGGLAYWWHSANRPVDNAVPGPASAAELAATPLRSPVVHPSTSPTRLPAAKPMASPVSPHLLKLFRDNDKISPDLRGRVGVLIEEQTDSRILASLNIDGIRVEDADLNLTPLPADQFQIRSGSIPALPENFPNFPEYDANEMATKVRNEYEKNSIHVQSVEVIAPSWLIHSDRSVTPCVNIEIQYSGPDAYEHDIMCLNAETGTQTRNRSVLKRF